MSRRPHRTHETRIARRRTGLLLKLGVWIFIAIFGLSVVGGIFIMGSTLGR